MGESERKQRMVFCIDLVTGDGRHNWYAASCRCHIATYYSSVQYACQCCLYNISSTDNIAYL